jgi:hypothetical protein
VNVQTVAALAANELRGRAASPDPVDEDWIARFFETIKDVSSEEMQQLWSKILAGEVVRPGSFSMRCLETVRNLGKQEAEAFHDFGPYVVGGRFILGNFLPGDRREWLNRALVLADAGLFTGDMNLSYAPTFVTGENAPLVVGSDLVVCVTAQVTQPASFPAYVLTGVAMELMTVTRQPADRQYAKALVDGLRSMRLTLRTVSAEPVSGGFRYNLDEPDLFPLNSPATIEESA